MTAERHLEWERAMVESRRLDSSGEVRADSPREILKTGTLDDAIWSLNFSCSSGNFAGFGNPMVYIGMP